MRRGERNAVAQPFGNREQIQRLATFFGGVVAIQIGHFLARAQEVVVIHGDVANARVRQRRYHGGFPHPLGQPGSLRTLAVAVFQLVRETGDLPEAILLRNHRQHRLGIACAKQFHLTACHHVAQQRHVFGEFVVQIIQQPAAEMDGKTEFRETVQHLQEGAIAAEMRVVDHFREIADRLMGVHAE